MFPPNLSLAIFGLNPNPTAPAAPLLPAALKPAAAASSSAHDAFDIVTAIKKRDDRAANRSGAIEVDPRKNDYLGEVPVIGQGLEMAGGYNAGGVFEADAMMRADAMPAYWAADR